MSSSNITGWNSLYLSDNMTLRMSIEFGDYIVRHNFIHLLPPSIKTLQLETDRLGNIWQIILCYNLLIKRINKWGMLITVLAEVFISKEEQTTVHWMFPVSTRNKSKRLSRVIYISPKVQTFSIDGAVRRRKITLNRNLGPTYLRYTRIRHRKSNSGVYSNRLLSVSSWSLCSTRVSKD